MKRYELYKSLVKNMSESMLGENCRISADTIDTEQLYIFQRSGKKKRWLSMIGLARKAGCLELAESVGADEWYRGSS
jgi:hypothetical protein